MTVSDLPSRLGQRARRPTSRPRMRLVYLVLLPTFIVLGFISYYPAFSAVFHSFFNWRPGFTSPFVGFANYQEMLHDGIWWRSFRNLGLIFLVGVTLAWAFPMLAAELVISLRSRRAQFVFRTLLIVPLAFPQTVVALVWAFLYNPNNGVINRLLDGIGLHQLAHNWVGQPDTALAALVFIGFPWIGSLPFLIFLSTLQNIPEEILEASALDGAGRLRRFVNVDLPLMARQIRLLVFLAVVSVLQYGLFAYLVTSGGPGDSTQVPVLQIIGVAFQGSEWGFAAALTTTLFFITLVASGVVLLLRRKEANDVQPL